MKLDKLLLNIVFVLSSIAMFAQEDCTNGIDDDNDGLIDLQDSDCDCNGIDIVVPTSLFPNPSFEVDSCSPGWGRAHCAVGWVNPSEGTPDYYDRCDAVVQTFLPVAPCDIPDGERFFGMADIYNNSLVHKEYVGTRLVAPMVAGETYALSFWLGFVKEPDPNWSSPPLDLVIFGNTDGSVINVPFDGKDCPTSVTVDSSGNAINPWVMLSSAHAANTNGLGWQQFRMEFTPTENYEAILLGPSCIQATGANYYFMDNLVLSTVDDFSTDFITIASGLACNNDMVLQVPDDLMTDVDYQWYKDGIAIVGATSPNISVAGLPFGNGTYNCVISNSFGCTMSDDYIVNEALPSLTFDVPSGFCAGETVEIGLVESFDSYAWSFGQSTDPTIQVNTADDYIVTVTDEHGCVISDTLNLSIYDDVDFTVIPTNESEPGAGDGVLTVNFGSGQTNAVIQWATGGNQNPYENLSSDLYCYTVTADEHCPVSDCIQLDMDIQPITIDPIIEPVRCHGEKNGAIRVTINGGLTPYSVSWDGLPSEDGQLNLSSLSADTYTLIVRDAQNTEERFSIEVGQPDPMTAELQFVAPSCHDAADASIRVANLAGGNGGYTYKWNASALNTDELTALRAGSYEVLISDDKNCNLELAQTIDGPGAIKPMIEVVPSFCIGADDGLIAIEQLTGGTPPFQYLLDGEERDAMMANLEGNRTYQLEIVDDNGCSFTDEIVVENQEIFEVSIGPDQQVEAYYTAFVQARANLDIASYHWQPSVGAAIFCDDCPSYKFTLEENTEIVLETVSEEGCTNTVTAMIFMTPSKKLYIPNAISPNGDGVNDKLEIFNADEVAQVLHFAVYNRAGQKIFSANNLSTEQVMDSFAATLDDKAYLPGTHAYVLKVQFKDETTKQLQGDLSIVR